MIIESKVREYLNSRLDVPVLNERTDGSSVPFVLISKTGTSNRDHLTTALIAIQSYAETMYQAALINQEVKEAMSEMPGEVDVSRAHLNSDYNYTNTNTNEYRYQAVFEISYIE